MRDNKKEDARKRGGGAFTIPILSMWKNRGGRINDGGRSGGTLRYMYQLKSLSTCTAYSSLESEDGSSIYTCTCILGCPVWDNTVRGPPHVVKHMYM